MAAMTDAALHVPLHRDEDAARGDPAREERLRRVAHHDLGADDECSRRRRIETRSLDELRDDSDLPAPGLRGRVHRDLDLEVPARFPTAELAPEDEVVRRARAAGVIGIALGLGCALAEDVTAPIDVPPFEGSVRIVY